MNTMVLTRPAERHQCLLRLPATPAALVGTWGRYRTPGGEAAYFTLAFAGEQS
jgi:hypothetical protein